ncbi:MAG: phosphatase, partial [Gammaproteobacteria bacterium]
LAKAGIEHAYENAKRIAGKGTVTRQHFSQFLVANGHAKNQSDVFKRYLVRNKPGYVSVDWPSLEETIESIHRAGGVAVIAHPLRYKITASKLRRLITAFKDNAGEAIEVVTGHNDSAEIQLATNYARQYELAASTGSDFHNEQTPWAQLGKLSLLPEGLTPVWQCWS